MSFVIGKEYLMPVVQNGDLDGGGTDVNAKCILHITHFLFAPSCIKRYLGLSYLFTYYNVFFGTRCHYTTQSVKMQLSNS